MKVVYQSDKYHVNRIVGIYARKIAADTLRIFEVADNHCTIREYDIVALSLISTGEFNDGEQHILTPMQCVIVDRLATIDYVLDDM